MNRIPLALPSVFAHRFMIMAALFVMSVPANGKDRELTPERADSILADEPLTLVVRNVGHYPSPGQPLGWTFSINSAGAGELTIDYGHGAPVAGKPSRQKIEVTVDKMAAIRKALRDERYFHLAEVDGLVPLHAGWTTLTATTGPLTAIKTFESPSWSGWTGDQQKAAAPAMRIFLAVCDAVDPDGKVFTELPKVRKVIRDLKK